MEKSVVVGIGWNQRHITACFKVQNGRCLCRSAEPGKPNRGPAATGESRLCGPPGGDPGKTGPRLACWLSTLLSLWNERNSLSHLIMGRLRRSRELPNSSPVRRLGRGPCKNRRRWFARLCWAVLSRPSILWLLCLSVCRSNNAVARPRTGNES